jgi:hypothetical protein
MKVFRLLALTLAVAGLAACASTPPDDQAALQHKAVFIVGDATTPADAAVADTPQPADGSGLKLKHISWYLSGR